jgi:hypothetical protein
MRNIVKVGKHLTVSPVVTALLFLKPFSRWRYRIRLIGHFMTSVDHFLTLVRRTSSDSTMRRLHAAKRKALNAMLLNVSCSR